MAKKKRSGWVERQSKDPFVKEAKRLGYRSRASFKLLEIQQRDAIIQPGMVVVDLGAAPGGWSDLLVKWVGPQGMVLAMDILLMDPIAGVEFIQGDITDAAIVAKLDASLAGRAVDWVVSDIAPNLSGMRSVDQPRSMGLVELAAYFAAQHLREGGGFLVKVFQGEGYPELLQSLRKQYKTVNARKPKSSRAESREVYVLARGFGIM